MSQYAYVNGQFVAADTARVSIYDRAFLFADAVYEVTPVIGGKLIDFPPHMARLRRSMAGLNMPEPLSEEALLTLHRELVERNDLQEGIIYLQISRGAAERDFLMPDEPQPTVVLFCTPMKVLDQARLAQGIRVCTLPDLRWQLCHLKTVGLLAASMAYTEARQQGFDDAWMVRDGMVTEGTSNNAFIVDAQGQIITRQLGNDILPGITRQAVLSAAAEVGVPVIERAFSVEEAYQASEAFITSASKFLMPVVQIDDHIIGTGQSGPVAARVRERYVELILEHAL